MSTKHQVASCLLVSGLLALAEGHVAQETNELNPADTLEDVLRRTDETHEKLTQKRHTAESDRKYSL